MVYTLYDSSGNSSDLDISKCVNLPETMTGGRRALSVDTQGQCAQFYSGKDCTGDSIEMLARSPSQGNLYAWNFQYRMESAGPCRDECSLNVTGPVPPAEGVNITIYGEPYYEGPVETITIKGCTPVPRKFNNRIESVNTTDNDNCFQLYNNWDCMCMDYGKRLVHDSIELRRGTPFHDDLSQWPVQRVKAISHCSYKCGKRIRKSGEVVVQRVNQIRLHDGPYYQGDSVQLEIKPGACLNLADGWEGAADSLQVSKNNSGNAPCFIMFQQKNCFGERSQKVNKSKTYLLRKPRSILNCNENNEAVQFNQTITVQKGTEIANNETCNVKKDQIEQEENNDRTYIPIVLSIFGILTVGFVLTGILICQKTKVKFGTVLYNRDNDGATLCNRIT